ncbi:Bud site selection protein 6 [Fusarium odoratissimum]|uniref:Bud site selection protein 6 n=1 Tax=Fusarium oxysporum f. sp. cubense (strain race 4) TaxID=2502994 RepID=N1RB15_FUSC4|nr:Bud site selection protein 6 [Fusarium odoratissimum]
MRGLLLGRLMWTQDRRRKRLADQSAAKEGVLGEVRALQPNHEDRLEAIERAEKLRQKELATRQVNPLHREITNFVADGKLKKSGGFEEVERARKAKDDRIRREVWQRQNGIIPENPIGEEGADAEADLEDEDAAFLRELEEDEARQAQAQADAEAEANQPPPPPPKDDDDKQPDQPNGA